VKASKEASSVMVETAANTAGNNDRYTMELGLDTTLTVAVEEVTEKMDPIILMKQQQQQIVKKSTRSKLLYYYYYYYDYY
jgi:hypothetical protein